MHPAQTRFPAGFLWGCATSAYQIEGSPLADGAGPSIWHRFAHTPGRIAGGDTGDVACDHYRRFQSDVELMQSLQLGAYRFSISWSRVLPHGTGRINAAGLGFYERLVDSLLARGITPMATLYHWDLPAALDDRVPFWSTLNEPWVAMNDGYLLGIHAPGHRSAFEATIVAHHLLLAHGTAVQAYRASGRQQIGLVVNIEPKYPASDDEADVAATRRADAYMNRQFLEPALRGTYPEELPVIFGQAWPAIRAADLETIHQPLDYIGVNYYTRSVVRADPSAWPLRTAAVRQNRLHTETGWEVFPQALTATLLWIKNRFGNPPVYITENGAAFFDPPTVDGAVLEDPLRVDYLRTHLRAVLDAIHQGADVRGYLAWSLLDNFEWAYGFSKRFGLVHVDYRTLKRTPKASAQFFARVIASNGAALDDAAH